MSRLAEVSRVLLEQVGQDPAERRRLLCRREPPTDSGPRGKVGVGGQRPRAFHLREVGLEDAGYSPLGRDGPLLGIATRGYGVTSSAANPHRIQRRSTPPRCWTRPSGAQPIGSTGVRSCASGSPAILHVSAMRILALPAEYCQMVTRTQHGCGSLSYQPTSHPRLDSNAGPGGYSLAEPLGRIIEGFTNNCRCGDD